MTDKLDDSILDVISTRLEARGEHAYFREMLHDYLDKVQIDSANTVLEIMLLYRGAMRIRPRPKNTTRKSRAR